jgi:hypothetical protein
MTPTETVELMLLTRGHTTAVIPEGELEETMSLGIEMSQGRLTSNDLLLMVLIMEHVAHLNPQAHCFLQLSFWNHHNFMSSSYICQQASLL